MVVNAFADPVMLKKRIGRESDDHYATIEFGGEHARNGTILRVEHVASTGMLETLLRDVFEYAGSVESHLRRVDDAGWWCAVACVVALGRGRPASVQRNQKRSMVHACVVTTSSSLLCLWPEWPLVRVVDRPVLLDLRPGVVLAEGPSDADLVRFGEGKGVQSGVVLLRELFDLGVIEWSSRPDQRSGRRVLRAVE